MESEVAGLLLHQRVDAVHALAGHVVVEDDHVAVELFGPLPQSVHVLPAAHGVVPQVIDAARERGLNVVDATCPYVKKVHVVEIILCPMVESMFSTILMPQQFCTHVGKSV